LDWSDEMATEVIFTDEFGAWYEGLSEAEQERVYRSSGCLRRTASRCRSALQCDEGASFALRELRAQVRGDPVAEKLWKEYLEETGQTNPRRSEK